MCIRERTHKTENWCVYEEEHTGRQSKQSVNIVYEEHNEGAEQLKCKQRERTQRQIEQSVNIAEEEQHTQTEQRRCKQNINMMNARNNTQQ